MHNVRLSLESLSTSTIFFIVPILLWFYLNIELPYISAGSIPSYCRIVYQVSDSSLQTETYLRSESQFEDIDLYYGINMLRKSSPDFSKLTSYGRKFKALRDMTFTVGILRSNAKLFITFCSYFIFGAEFKIVRNAESFFSCTYVSLKMQ